MAELSRIQLESVFNPYSEQCPLFDRADAAEIRRTNLLLLLKAALKRQVHSVWLGRDLGYRGGRRTGIALTDEVHLQTMGNAFGVNLSQATAGPPLQERTATIIWNVLPFVPAQVFFWNVFPFHPFEPGQPLSNRCHKRDEREKCQHLLSQLLQMLQPQQVVAIGQDAKIGLEQCHVISATVRHPSYGGQTAFVQGMERLYNIAVHQKTLPLLEYGD